MQVNHTRGTRSSIRGSCYGWQVGGGVSYGQASVLPRAPAVIGVGVAGGARADPEAVEGPHEVQVEGRVAAEEERPRAIGPQCQNPGAVGPMGAGVLQQRLAILALQPQADDAQRAAVLVQ